MRFILLLGCCVVIAGWANAAELIVKLPEKCAAKSAQAVAADSKTPVSAKIDSKAQQVRFENLPADSPCDITLTLSDGTVLQGINLSWYGLAAPKPDAAPLDDDDRKAITDLIYNPKAFENKQNILFMKGDNTRATVLVELIRDKDFHAADGNIIWRVELWYFENQFGGWAKVAQQNKVLRRERFKDQAAFDAAVKKIKWIPELGGITLPKGKSSAEITLPRPALSPKEPTKPPEKE
jgi:hypothetical protein